MQTALQANNVFVGSTASLRGARTTSASAARGVVIVRAQQQSDNGVDRRAALGLIAAAVAAARVAPAEAAYGDAARVFAGKVTNKSGFVPYAGEGYALLLPSKWNPSKERDFQGVDLRYEDNFDAVNNLVVIKKKTDKNAISDYGSIDKFLNEQAYLFGDQSYSGSTKSEGGFAPNKVSAASLLDVKENVDKNGKKYYEYELLVRTADGDEGGRHQLIKATVNSGYLYILKVQVGDKRWFKGAKKEATGAIESFTVV